MKITSDKSLAGQRADPEGPARVKFEVLGEEMIEKMVKLSLKSGRVYLPPHWVGSRVKVIRID